MSRLLLAARLLAAVPLLSIGMQHLTGAAPIQPILEGAGFPFPELGALAAPLGEVLAGTLLLLGFLPRLGALMAVGSMAGALVAHVRLDWEGEPSIVLPLAVLAAALLVIAKGPGALAVHGGRARSASSPAQAQSQ